MASGKPGWVPGGFASNGYGDLSPGKYGLASCFLIEVTANLLLPVRHHRHHLESRGCWICRDTHRALPYAHSPLPDPVTNASVNPARSTGPALFAGGAYIAQLWLFWLAPILGAVIAGVVSRWQHDVPE